MFCLFIFFIFFFLQNSKTLTSDNDHIFLFFNAEKVIKANRQKSDRVGCNFRIGVRRQILGFMLVKWVKHGG